MSKKIYINKEVWLQSQINYLNQEAEQLHEAQEKAISFAKIHINDDLNIVINSEYDSLKKYAERLEKRFYADYVGVCKQWEKLKDEETKD